MASTGRRVQIGALAVLMLLAAGGVVVAGRSGDGDGSSPTSTAHRTTTTGSGPVPTTTQGVRPSTTAVASTTRPSRPTTLPASTTVPASPALAVRRVATTQPVVALTFDAGSDVGHAPAILDALNANGIQATFGMTGRWAEDNPALVRRMVSEGHQLVNHSYDHPSFTGRSTGAAPLPRDARIDQLERAERAVQAAADVTMAPWFRPPYGDEDASVRADVGAQGYRYELLWTVDSLGWKGVAPAEVVQRCVAGAVPGAIYLFHVGAASTDAAALQSVIDELRRLGFGFQTASGLFALTGT